MHSLGKRTEDYALFSKSRTECGGHRNRIEYGIHSHSGKSLTLMKRNTELVECLLKLRINLLRTVLCLLWCGIVDDVLKVDFRNIKMSPFRKDHLLPVAESLQTELQHPFRLILLRRNKTDYILIQTLRYELLLDIRHKAVLILLVCNII